MHAYALKLTGVVAISLPLLGATSPPDYRAAARSIDQTITDKYAYLDKLPGGTVPRSRVLDTERDSVVDRASLLRYAEDRLASLADHHAITGSSFSNSWAIVPSFADLWIVAEGGTYKVDAVRPGSPAMNAGICRGDILVSIGDVPISAAVTTFWRNLGLDVTPRRAAYAARVLAAGRRDRSRKLGIQPAGARVRLLTLPSLYENERQQPPFSVYYNEQTATIQANNSLGDDAAIRAFDQAMARVSPAMRVTLDLRDTPSGGNTVVARAILGWFVDHARGYQIHNRPEDERSTGIPHQWIEEVLPRTGKYTSNLPDVLVGRWTGSMGEGLAVGFAALGARVEGDRMAGLNGSVEDIPLGNTDLTIKLPTERLMTMTGVAREDFRPEPPSSPSDGCGSRRLQPNR